MKICPKCRRTYAESVDFCLRDGKPLTDLEAEHTPVDSEQAGGAPAPAAEARTVPVPETPSTSGAAGRRRSPPPGPAGGLRSVLPPTPVAEARRDSERPPADGPVSTSPRGPGEPGSGIRPWVPGQVRDTSVSGVRLTMPANLTSQPPPWEMAEPIPPARVTIPRPPPPTPEPEPELEEEEVVVRTPDLPLPPENRDEAAPVGDETILVLQPEEGPDLMDSLELESVPTPPPEPEIPLVSRVTSRSAISRPVFAADSPRPPVDDVDEPEPRLAIHTEEEIVPPLPGEDEDGDPSFIVVTPNRPNRSRPVVDDMPPIRRSNALLYGMLTVVAAAVLVAVLLWSTGSGRRDTVQTGGSVPSDALGVAPPAVSIPLEAGAPASGVNGSTDLAIADSAVGAGPQPGAGVQPQPKPSESGQPAGRDVLTSGAAGVSDTGPVDGARDTEPMGGAGGTAGPRPASSPAEAADDSAAGRPASDGGDARGDAASAAPAPTSSPARASAGRPAVTASPASARTQTAAAGKPSGRPAGGTGDSPRTGGGAGSSASTAAPSTAPGLTVVVTSNEIGADVYVDNNRVGRTPTTLTLPAGPHTIKVKPEGKPEQEQTVVVDQSVEPGQRERKYFPF